MAVYKNIEVEIPKSHVTIERQRGGKPALIKYVIEAPYDREKGYARPKRTTIGHQCIGSTTMMHPTTQYAEIFPSQWEKISNEKVRPSVKKMGMFTACQAINYKTGIKDILDGTYGKDRANALIDYAMYSIIHHTDNAEAFSYKMKDELTYSKELCSDSYYSRLFEEHMSKEMELDFKQKWALQCKEDGVETVWLCIDGSNDDCESKGVELAEKGHAKSKKNINIVSFTYAVTPDGKPVTYDVYRGGLVDAKAMKSILNFLKECGIKVSGVILDRGYCDTNVIRYLVKHEITYVIMVKGSPDGYENMLGECAGKIKMNTDYLIPHTYLFGCQKEVQLFKNYNHKDYLTLFFDYRNGGDRITALLKNLYKEMSRLETGIKNGETPSVDKAYEKLLSIGDDRQVEINSSNLQAVMDKKGLYSIVTSSSMQPAEVHRLYVSRSSSETQYRLIKTQLGYGTMRVQYTAGVRARFTVGFIASILRYEIETAAANVERNTNQIVRELELIEAQKLNGAYAYTHTENARVKAFFASMSINAQTLIDESVKYENDRQAGRMPMPRHRKPGPKKGNHKKVLDKQDNTVVGKPGVSKGTKRGDINKDGTPRKKPGVKPGTKRGKYNKDGSLRKKPGPKVKIEG